jgi:hypothetical protein
VLSPRPLMIWQKSSVGRYFKPPIISVDRACVLNIGQFVKLSLIRVQLQADNIQIVLETLSQHCSRLFQEPATVLR